MELQDSRDINASRSTVWAALQDPAVLKACVPGAQEITGTANDGFDAVVVQKVGPVKATFRGTVRFEDRTPETALTLIGEGKGGVAGFAKGQASVQLEEIETGTRLSYDVQANVGGKIAQLGNRIIGGFARKMADQFFERLAEQLESETDT